MASNALSTAALLERAFTGLRVLVLVEELDTLESLTMLLVLEGAEVRPARRMEQALDLVRTRELDVLLVHRAIAERHGAELLAEARLRSGDEVLGVVLGDAEPSDGEDLPRGFAAQLARPMLLTALSRIARRGEGSRGAP